jgi:hypothetical protein
MKRIVFKILLFILSLCLLGGCSTHYWQESFSDYTDSTKVINKNTAYCLEQLFAEEINTRIAESVQKESFLQSDLEPKVLTWVQLEHRKELLDYIFDYVSLLETIAGKDYEKDLAKNSESVKTSLENIKSYNDDLMDQKTLGILATVINGMNESLTQSNRRFFLLKIMRLHQPLLESATLKLKEELETAKVMINDFFNRQYLLTVTLPWPEKETQREKYAKLGVKILDRKRKINSLLDAASKAVQQIAQTHGELLGILQNKDKPLRPLAQLVNFAGRLEAMYTEYANEKKKK